MKDGDVHIVITLVKRAIKKYPPAFMERLATESGSDPFKILIACVLSLRTRDQVAAEASERLFSLSTDPFSMRDVNLKKLEKAIFPVGFYRTKAKQISAMCKQICEEFQGIVPDEIDSLLKLPGVGRKTANLVRTVGYRKPGICVDIHVHRICNRLGYVATKSPDETEDVLRQKLPGKYWISLNSLLVSFGQNQCTPTSPRCSSCLISFHCQQLGVLSAR